MTAQVTQTWQHTTPKDTDQCYDLQLLTICGVSVLGRWAGEFGEYFVGWSYPLNTVRSQLLPYQIQPQDHYQQHVN